MNSAHENLSYDESDPKMRLDLYLPAESPATSVLFFIHGGAWISGDKSDLAELGRQFARDGIAFAAPNYRLSTDERVKSPAHVQDLAAAYRWLVVNARTWDLHQPRIFVGGHSAGAHCAAMLATGHDLRTARISVDRMPAGFIGIQGIYDVETLSDHFPSYDDWFLYAAFGDRSRWKALCPTRRAVVDRSPWLIAHSTEDTLVDLDQSERFAVHLTHSTVTVQTLFEPFGDHDAALLNLLDPTRDLYRAVMGLIRAQHPG